MICTFYTKGLVCGTLLFNIITIIIISVVIIIAQATNADQNVKTIQAANLHKIDSNEKTDMLMMPNDLRSLALLRPDQANLHPLRAQQFQPGIVHPSFAARSYTPPSRPVDPHKPAAQNFFPSFIHNAPPLGHSRPYLTNAEGPTLNKFGIQHAENGAAAIGLHQNNYDSILGSGDFGVLRGGTFYPDDEMPYHIDDHTNFDPYYGGDANNGHGRPSSDGFVQTYTYPEEQFANFRDFADINTPADTAFSQFAVVYASKNATKSNNKSANVNSQPKNIFEKLELLDKQKAMEEKKKKKQTHSKVKSKYAKTKHDEKSKKTQNYQNMDSEPLLALS